MNTRFCLLTIAAAALCTAAPSSAKTPIKEVPFTAVHINDAFWAPRIETNRSISIPSAFRECEKNGRFDNFALAAGLIKGEHKGDFPFDDTDPYKILEGASYSLAVKYDKRLDAYCDSVIALIAAAQEPDGYLTTCVTNKATRLKGWWGSGRWEKINSHELYNSGHLYEAAVAHYLATGKRSLLDVAIKNANLVCNVFGSAPGQKHVPSGHPIVEMALAKLYKITGNRRYLETAKYFVDEAGRGTDGHKLSEYSQDHIPVLQQEEIKGHAVRAGYFYSGVADVAALTGDEDYFKAITRIWNNMASRKLYISGGIGSRAQGEGFGPEYELHNHTAYCETCAAIANVYWNYRMLLATGDAKFADVFERALYNGVISGVALSGDKFFYDNPLQSMGEHERQAWFGCACCPGNITRFMASIPTYMYATQGNDLLVNLYIGSQANIQTENNKLRITQQTEYPWKGKIRFSIDPETSAAFSIRFRIPGWAADSPVPSSLYSFIDKPSGCFTLKVNGKRVHSEISSGYASVERMWKKGDIVELELPMDVRRIHAHEKVSDDAGKTAFQRGPVVYCLEGTDQPDGIVFDKFITTDASIACHFEPSLLGGVVTLSGKAGKKLPDGRIDFTQFKAVPYSVWNNRGKGEMAVWIPETAEKARAVPMATLASKARMYSEPTSLNAEAPAATSNLQDAWGYNDQWEPASSSDTSKPYQYWWLRKGTLDNICYSWDEPQQISSVDVYWLDFDHYDGNYRVPASWKLYYKDDAGIWKEVAAKGDYTTLKDQYNHLDFDTVSTTALKISAQMQQGQSGGVIEWKVN